MTRPKDFFATFPQYIRKSPGIAKWLAVGLFLAAFSVIPCSASTLPDTTSFSMTSKVTGRTYRIFMAWPRVAAPAEGYPVIYMTDANTRFVTMVETARNYSRHFREDGADAVIVGIGYLQDVAANESRSFDLTPRLGADETPPGYGGADGFLRFILHELKPRVESEFRIDTSRQILWGHSFGGLFALHTLFNQPDAFQTYLVASPSIWWGERFVLKQEYPRLVPKLEKTGATVRVLLTVGEFEDSDPTRPPRKLTAQQRRRPQLPGIADRTQVDDIRNLAKALADTSGLAVRFTLFTGEDHGTVVPAAISRGIRIAFGPGFEPPERAPMPRDLAGETRIPVPSSEQYLAMSPEQRYELRIEVRAWPPDERERFWAQLKYNLDAGLWFGDHYALYEERNAMDKKHGTRPVED